MKSLLNVYIKQPLDHETNSVISSNTIYSENIVKFRTLFYSIVNNPDKKKM